MVGEGKVEEVPKKSFFRNKIVTYFVAPLILIYGGSLIGSYFAAKDYKFQVTQLEETVIAKDEDLSRINIKYFKLQKTNKPLKDKNQELLKKNGVIFEEKKSCESEMETILGEKESWEDEKDGLYVRIDNLKNENETNESSISRKYERIIGDLVKQNTQLKYNFSELGLCKESLTDIQNKNKTLEERMFKQKKISRETDSSTYKIKKTSGKNGFPKERRNPNYPWK